MKKLTKKKKVKEKDQSTDNNVDPEEITGEVVEIPAGQQDNKADGEDAPADSTETSTPISLAVKKKATAAKKKTVGVPKKFPKKIMG